MAQFIVVSKTSALSTLEEILQAEIDTIEAMSAAHYVQEAQVCYNREGDQVDGTNGRYFGMILYTDGL